MTKITKKIAARPVGRPRTTIDDLPKDWKKICVCCGMGGGSDVKTRVLLGIADNAWYTLLKDSEEFRQTISETKRLSQVWWEDAGQHLTIEGKGSAVTWIFNMKNRCGWRDQSNINHSSSDGSMSPAKEIKIEIMEITDGNDDDDD